MKAQIIEGCIGCGLCVSTCPEVFRMTDEGVAEAYQSPRPEDEPCVQEAANGCPVSVILVRD